jgi:hypothetical protein
MGVCPLAETQIKRIPLTCTVPIDFEFTVTTTQPNSAIRVTPESGVIPARGSIDLIVAFTPINYVTSHMTFELTLTQFAAKPMSCQVTGASAPGLVTAKHLKVAPPPSTSEPRTHRATAHKARVAQSQRIPQSTVAQSVANDTPSIPNLSTVHHINQLLNQPALEGLNAVSVLDANPHRPQPREALSTQFSKELRDASAKLSKGSPGLSHEDRRDILAQRREAELIYLSAQGIGLSFCDNLIAVMPTVVPSLSGASVEASAADRKAAKLDAVPTRTFRRIESAVALPDSMVWIPDMQVEWQRRAESLGRFIRAARTVTRRIMIAPLYICH